MRRYELMVVVLMGSLPVLTALNARAQEDSFQSKLKEVQQTYNSHVDSNKIDISKIGNIPQELQDLANKASRLDELVSEINSKNSELSDLSSDSANAESKARGLEQQLENEGESDKSRVNSLVAQQSAICSQMGGSVQGQQCVFTCPQDNMAPCQSKLSQFNAQVAQILAQIRSIAQSLKELSDRVDAAQSAAQVKKDALKSAQATIAQDERQRNTQESEFNTLLKKTKSDIESAQKTGSNVPNELSSPAARQLPGIAEQPNTRRGNEVHSQFDDFSHYGDAIRIDSTTVPAANQKAIDKSPQYKTAYDQKKAEYDKAVSESTQAEVAFQKAVSSGATKEAMSDLYKALMEKKSAVIYKQYQVNMLTGSQPKPADTVVGVAQ
jgi:hypothetical protein